jgi:hypothetical protein
MNEHGSSILVGQPYQKAVFIFILWCAINGPRDLADSHSIIRMKDILFGDLVNFMHMVKYGKQYLSCNGIYAFYIHKSRMLETAQWEWREKWVVSSTICLMLYVQFQQ